MTTLYKSKYLEFKSAKSSSGGDWFYAKRTNDSDSHDSAVAIATLVKNNNDYDFVFLKTKRPPILAENKAKYCLELPAGLIADDNKDETLLECAKKELIEETGYIADKIYIELKNSSTSAGLSSETLTYITAIVEDNKVVSKPVDDGGIIVERILISRKNVYNYLNSLDTKEISVSSALVCGLYYALNRINLYNKDTI